MNARERRNAERAEQFKKSPQGDAAEIAEQSLKSDTGDIGCPGTIIQGQGDLPKRWERKMEREAISRAIRDALPDQDITDVFKAQVTIAKNEANPRQSSIAAGIVSKALDKLLTDDDDKSSGGTVINGDVLIQQAYKQFDEQEPEYREWKRKQQLRTLVGPIDVGRNGFKSEILRPTSLDSTE